MALVIFRSRASGEIIMMSDTAQRLLEVIGKPLGERGVITSDQLDTALSLLTQAVAQEPMADAPDAADGGPARHVSLRQRAYPLMRMLRAARQRGVDVTWGV